MPCGREIRLRRVKSLRRWGFISFHLMRSGKYHNLQSELFHRERSERFHFLLRLNALNIGRGSCQGSEHRAACGRWSGALSRKKQRALRAPQASKATMFLTERVVGSSPTGGARKKHLQMQVLFQLSAPSVHEKNEGASLMKCGQTAWKLKARFTSCEYSERFMTTKLSLCVCRTNTSFIEISLY